MPPVGGLGGGIPVHVDPIIPTAVDVDPLASDDDDTLMATAAHVDPLAISDEDSDDPAAFFAAHADPIDTSADEESDDEPLVTAPTRSLLDDFMSDVEDDSQEDDNISMSSGSSVFSTTSAHTALRKSKTRKVKAAKRISKTSAKPKGRFKQFKPAPFVIPKARPATSLQAFKNRHTQKDQYGAYITNPNDFYVEPVADKRITGHPKLPKLPDDHPRGPALRTAIDNGEFGPLRLFMNENTNREDVELTVHPYDPPDLDTVVAEFNNLVEVLPYYTDMFAIYDSARNKEFYELAGLMSEDKNSYTYFKSPQIRTVIANAAIAARTGENISVRAQSLYTVISKNKQYFSDAYGATRVDSFCEVASHWRELKADAQLMGEVHFHMRYLLESLRPVL